MTTELYPQPIGDFDAWWHDKQRRVATANSESEITRTIGEVASYEAPLWIMKGRCDDLRRIADKRRKELGIAKSRATVDRMTGEVIE